jgi:hypothetical protein
VSVRQETHAERCSHPALGRGQRSRDTVVIVTDLRDKPLSDVVALVLADVKSDEGDGPVGHLVELQSRADEETLATALRLTHSADLDERALGILILRELGPYDSDGRRPYSAFAIPRLLDMLAEAPELAEECNVLRALAFNGAREALPVFLARSGHPDLAVRTTVAFQLPSVVDPSQVEAEALTALEQLAHDDDADVRYLPSMPCWPRNSESLPAQPVVR